MIQQSLHRDAKPPGDALEEDVRKQAGKRRGRCLCLRAPSWRDILCAENQDLARASQPEDIPRAENHNHAHAPQ